MVMFFVCLLLVRLLFSSMAVICTTRVRDKLAAKGPLRSLSTVYSVYHLVGGCEQWCMEKLHDQLKSLMKTLLYKLESIIIPSRCSGNEPMHITSHAFRETYRGEQTAVFHLYYQQNVIYYQYPFQLFFGQPCPLFISQLPNFYSIQFFFLLSDLGGL